VVAGEEPTQLREFRGSWLGLDYLMWISSSLRDISSLLALSTFALPLIRAGLQVAARKAGTSVPQHRSSSALLPSTGVLGVRQVAGMVLPSFSPPAQLLCTLPSAPSSACPSPSLAWEMPVRTPSRDPLHHHS